MWKLSKSAHNTSVYNPLARSEMQAHLYLQRRLKNAVYVPGDVCPTENGVYFSKKKEHKVNIGGQLGRFDIPFHRNPLMTISFLPLCIIGTRFSS